MSRVLGGELRVQAPVDIKLVEGGVEIHALYGSHVVASHSTATKGLMRKWTSPIVAQCRFRVVSEPCAREHASTDTKYTGSPIGDILDPALDRIDRMFGRKGGTS